MIKTKSVYSPIDRKKDGLRLLVTRFRGRGLRKTRYDVWMPSLGPSEQLLQKFSEGKITWTAFRPEYKAEIFMDGPVDERCKTIKNHGQKFSLRLIKKLASRGPITLLCHCDEEQEECHRHLLQSVILSSKI
jgi:uncharacterized protein YeaO (DUF488 family)